MIFTWQYLSLKYNNADVTTLTFDRLMCWTFLWNLSPWGNFLNKKRACKVKIENIFQIPENIIFTLKSEFFWKIGLAWTNLRTKTCLPGKNFSLFWLNWTLLDPTWPHLTIIDPTWPYMNLLDPTCPYLSPLDCKFTHFDHHWAPNSFQIESMGRN